MKKIIIILGLCNVINPMENIKNKESQCIVKFKPSENGLSQVTQNILKEISNPTIVVWYGGEDGLTTRNKDFYEKNLITSLKQVNTSPKNRKPFQLYLYDLNGWNILKGQEQSPSIPLESIIQDCKYNNTQSISSQEFFQWLCAFNQEQIDAASAILNRPFIWKKSDEYYNKKIKMNQNQLYKKTLSQVIDIENYPNEFKQYFEAKDNVLIYSALQYLEAFFITQKLSQSESSEIRNIVFLLPGDEYTYYTDKTNKRCAALQDDLNIFFAKSSSTIPQQLQLYFYSFKYLHDGCTRPYLKLDSDSLYLNQHTK